MSDKVKAIRWYGSLIALMLLVCGFISGCSDPEPRQRSAFIVFLQTEINNKNRVNLPPLTQEQQESIGKYSQEYALLTEFNQQVKTVLAPVEQAVMVIPAMNNMQQLIEQKQHIDDALLKIKTANSQLEKVIAESTSAYNALQQPEELKKVFDEAYQRIVTHEVVTAQQALPLLEKLYTNMLDMINFVHSKGDKVSFNEGAIEFSTPEDVETFNRLNQTIQETYQRYKTLSQLQQ